MSFYIFHTHRVCLVDHVNLICSLYSWLEGFGSSSLATLPLDFNCGFIFTSACGFSTGVCSWGCPGGLGSAPVRARCGGHIVAWASGVLAAPRTQGSWWLMQQEIQCSRRVWQPVLTSTVQYWDTLRENLPDREAWQSTAHRLVKSWTRLKQPCMDRCKTPFCLWWLCPSGGWAWRWCNYLGCQNPGGANCAGTWNASAAGVMALSESFFWASCSWWSEGLFGQSFSIVPPVQALRGLPCLGTFSVVRCIRHIDSQSTPQTSPAPRLGSACTSST